MDGLRQLTHHEAPSTGDSYMETILRKRRNDEIYIRVFKYLRDTKHRSWVPSMSIAAALSITPLTLANALEEKSRSVLKRGNGEWLEYRLCDSLGGEEHLQKSKAQIARDSDRLAAQLIGQGMVIS